MSMRDAGANVTTIIRCRNEEQYLGFALQSVADHLPVPASC